MTLLWKLILELFAYFYLYHHPHAHLLFQHCYYPFNVFIHRYDRLHVGVCYHGLGGPDPSQSAHRSLSPLTAFPWGFFAEACPGLGCKGERCGSVGSAP